MRVLIVTPNYPSPLNEVGGSFYRTQARALRDAGAQVEVIFPRPWTPPGFARLSSRWSRYVSTPARYSLDGIQVHAPTMLFPPRDLRLGVGYHGFAREVAAAARRMRPDIIHGHFGYPSGLASVIAATIIGAPSVVTLHGSDVHTHPFRGRRPKKLFCTTAQEASALLAVSESLAATTEHLSGRRPLVMPIGIDLQRFLDGPSRESARSGLGIHMEFLVLFVGHMTEAKGVPELLESLDRLPAFVRCVFAGPGHLLERARRSSRAIVFGPTHPSSIPLLMAAADLVVLPSHYEGLPTVLVEAGAACRAVVATPVGGIPELLGENRGYLLQASPASPKDIASTIIACLHDRNGREARAMSLHRHVIERYDARLSARRLLAEYERLCRR